MTWTGVLYIKTDDTTYQKVASIINWDLCRNISTLEVIWTHEGIWVSALESSDVYLQIENGNDLIRGNGRVTSYAISSESISIQLEHRKIDYSNNMRPDKIYVETPKPEIKANYTSQRSVSDLCDELDSLFNK